MRSFERDEQVRTALQWERRATLVRHSDNQLVQLERQFPWVRISATIFFFLKKETKFFLV